MAAYSEFQKNVSKKFESLFDEISASYNFDNGPEFETALCKALRIILPNKYGVCRGFIVSKEGIEKGDDIIIYDRDRFPTLRLLEDNTYAQKQKIPIESVYAYIEAKHTLYLEGNGGQSLEKAAKQIEDVKSLKRASVPLTRVSPLAQISNYIPDRPEYWPNCHNPLYCAIISRHIKMKESDKDEINISNESTETYMKYRCAYLSSKIHVPDLIIANSNIIILPKVMTEIQSPFFVKGFSQLDVFKTEGLAFVTGLTLMLYAFDHMLLGSIHYPSIIADALGISMTNYSEE